MVPPSSLPEDEGSCHQNTTMVEASNGNEETRADAARFRSSASVMARQTTGVQIQLCQEENRSAAVQMQRVSCEKTFEKQALGNIDNTSIRQRYV